SIDFAIGRISRMSEGPEFETETLFDQQQVVVAGRDKSWGKRKPADLADLLTEPWVLPSKETTSGQLAADVFRIRGLSIPRAVVQTSSFELTRALLEGGPFLALMPATIVSAFSRYSSLRRVTVQLPRQTAPVGIIRLRKRACVPLATR